MQAVRFVRRTAHATPGATMRVAQDPPLRRRSTRKRIKDAFDAASVAVARAVTFHKPKDKPRLVHISHGIVRPEVPEPAAEADLVFHASDLSPDLAQAASNPWLSYEEAMSYSQMDLLIRDLDSFFGGSSARTSRQASRAQTPTPDAGPAPPPPPIPKHVMAIRPPATPSPPPLPPPPRGYAAPPALKPWREDWHRRNMALLGFPQPPAGHPYFKPNRSQELIGLTPVAMPPPLRTSKSMPRVHFVAEKPPKALWDWI